MKFRNVIWLLLTYVLTSCGGEAAVSLKKAVETSTAGIAMLEESKTNGLDADERKNKEEASKKLIIEAEDMYKTLIENEPSNGTYYNNLGWLYMKSGNLSAAREQFNKALAFKGSVLPSDAVDKNITDLSKLENSN